MNENSTRPDAGNILIVDDTPANLDLLTEILKQWGYRIRPASNGRMALQAAKLEPPELILLDINMPDLDGFEVCRLLKQNQKLCDIPVIFISSYNNAPEKVKAFSMGGVDYITKPFQFEEVRARIQTHLKLYRSQSLMENWNRQLELKVKEQTLDLLLKNEKLVFLVDKLKINYRETIGAISNLIELHNTRTRNHSSNVAEIASQVAAAIGMSSFDIETVQVAGYLHDIGKIGIRDTIGLKNGNTMQAEKFEKYRLHPLRGQAAIDSIEDLREAGKLIRHHHECYDGSGFPDKLKGKQIPLGARILSIADFFDWSILFSTSQDPIGDAFNQIRTEMRHKFDQDLIVWFDKPVREFYLSPYFEEVRSGVEVSLENLKPGMVLATDIISGTGLLLFKKDSSLNERTILNLRRIYFLDPPTSGIFIYPFV